MTRTARLMRDLAQATVTVAAHHIEVDSHIANGYHSAETPRRFGSLDAALTQLQRVLAPSDRIGTLATQRLQLADAPL